MKKIITFLTATRAEYGLLKRLILLLEKNNLFEVRVVVTGAHLISEFGFTYKEIEKDGIKIHKKIDILLASDSTSAVAKSMALALIGFSDYFEQYPCDALIVLGDRYETLSVCIAAINNKIPIVHLHGGETTEGAIDEAIRHSISKMSAIHFVACEKYRKRVIQLGELPQNVFNVGALGVENVLKTDLFSISDLEENLNFSLINKKYSVVTFHPVTLEDNSAETQAHELVKAMDEFAEIQFIITKANADAGGRAINKIWDELAPSHKNWLVIESLGMKRYLSALKNASFMLGNSSSGIIEGPVMKIPTVNIGDRQKGRIMSRSVLSCPTETKKIIETIKIALSSEVQQIAREVECPFGDGETSIKIVKILEKTFAENSTIPVQKKFYDIKFKI